MLDVTQLINVRHNSHVGFQESTPPSYAPQYWEPPCANPPNHTRVFSNPTSPCSTVTSPYASLSSIAWSDSVPSPTQHSQHHSHLEDAISETNSQLNLPAHPGPPSVSASAAPSPTLHSHGRRQHSDDAINKSELQLDLPSYPPSVPQMASPVYTQPQKQQQQQQEGNQDQPPPLEAPAPSPPSAPSSPALDSTLLQDLVGRRAPKRRRITRAVQPLACYFCRGRKIACSPPTNPGGGDRTCEYVFERLLTSKNFIFV